MANIKVILDAIAEVKTSNKSLNNTEIISILKATKTIADDTSVISSLLQMQTTLSPKAKARITTLTTREKQVLSLIGKGKLTNTIAKELGLSPSTIETHRKNIRRKLHLVGKGKLFEYALLNNLIEKKNDDNPC